MIKSLIACALLVSLTGCFEKKHNENIDIVATNQDSNIQYPETKKGNVVDSFYDIKIADPYSELILDPNSDGGINNTTFPNMHPYPSGQTTGFVTVLHPGKPAYNWQVPNFVAPAKTDLVIYEMLVRDFVATHNYQTIIDSLDYLSNLGIISSFY